MSFFSIYMRNIIAGATCNVRDIKTIDVRQIMLSITLQVALLLYIPDALAVETAIGLGLAYVICMVTNLRRTQILSIFPPVAVALTLVAPALVGMDLAFDSSFNSLIACFPIVFRYIDDKVIAYERSVANANQDSFFSDPDSRLHGIVALNQARSMADMDESVLKLMRSARPLEFGPEIGTYCNAPIYSWIKTVDGSFYDFESSLSPGARYGFPANDRMVIPPGLMYLKRSST